MTTGKGPDGCGVRLSVLLLRHLVQVLIEQLDALAEAADELATSTQQLDPASQHRLVAVAERHGHDCLTQLGMAAEAVVRYRAALLRFTV
jgi:hypothetical protein